MIRRSSLVVLALVLALAVPAWAATGDVAGTVTYIDPATHTIHFTDGRIVHVKPGSRVSLNGQEVAFDAIRPGMLVMIAPGAATTGAVTTGAATPGARAATAPVATAPATTLVPEHPPVDVSGVVASVDRASGTITFQDGRVLSVPSRTVWQALTLDSVQPGQQVWVNGARPLAFQPSAAPSGYRERMGTVARVEPSGQTVVLTDGTTVRLAPGSAVSMAGQRLTVTDLRPGDEIVVRVVQPSAPAVSVPAAPSIRRDTGPYVSASPRTDRSWLDANEILIVRRPQAP